MKRPISPVTDAIISTYKLNTPTTFTLTPTMFTLHATLRHVMRVTGASRAILRAAARPQNSLARSYARQFHPITNRLPLPAAPGTMTGS